jgi:pimeloyl-ACP methyl ester carboxylesterase
VPTVRANHLKINYDQQGAGDPLILVPYLAADHACYAFQVAEFARHFTCISVDPRGAGGTEAPDETCSTELLGDDIAAFMTALGIERAHIFGLSLGAAAAMWLAVKHPGRVRSLSLHSAWPRTDGFLETVVESWRALARILPSVTDVILTGIFPWCFTPELYSGKPEYIQSLRDFVRSRPAMPRDVFLRQTEAVLAHDVEPQLARIAAPTQITFGRRDALTSTRFAERLTGAIRGSELTIFEECAHAPIYERVEEFNQRALAFLTRHAA